MNRLLGPEETKFWLLDRAHPFNAILVLRRRGPIVVDEKIADSFRLPAVAVAADGRPRWGAVPHAGTAAEIAAEEDDWPQHAQELLALRAGTEGHPCWHLRLLRHRTCTTLLLSMLHAVIDMRSALAIGHALLAGRRPAALPPSFEELLPPALFAEANASAILERWWSTETGRQWQAIGTERITAMLPPAAPSSLFALQMEPSETEALVARCGAERASLGCALVATLQDVLGVRSVGHSLDLRRFIDPPLPATAPGIAVSHITTQLSPDASQPFWQRARAVRAELQRGVRSGVAGDILLTLPRALRGETTGRPADAPEVTISYSRFNDADLDASRLHTAIGIAPARSGAVLTAATARGRLELVAASPACATPLPLRAVATRLRQVI